MLLFLAKDSGFFFTPIFWLEDGVLQLYVNFVLLHLSNFSNKIFSMMEQLLSVWGVFYIRLDIFLWISSLQYSISVIFMIFFSIIDLGSFALG